MKLIKLLSIFMLCLCFLSQCSQPTTQSPQNLSWWQRSTNYAASWIPQSVKNKYHTYWYEKFLISRINQIFNIMIKNSESESNIEIKINNLIKQAFTDAKKYNFEPKDMINKAIIYSGRRLAADVNQEIDLLIYNKPRYESKFDQEKRKKQQEKLKEDFKKEAAIFKTLIAKIKKSMQNISSTNNVGQSAASR